MRFVCNLEFVTWDFSTFMSRRSEQLSGEIQHYLNDFLVKEAEVPRDLLITITEVKVTEDLEMAFVSLSVLPVDKSGTAVRFFEAVMPEAARYLSRYLKIRRVPKIKVKIDEYALKHRRVERALEDIN